MKLSRVQDQVIEPRCHEDAAPRLLDFEVPVPAHLSVYGTTTRASLYGRDDAPLVIVLGGISGNRFPALCPDGGPGWWAGFLGKGGAIDPADYRILGLDFIADATGKRAPTPFEQAEVARAALDVLGVERAHAFVGPSYGGMIALAFGQAYPDRVERLVVVSAGAEPHPTATAQRELQRRIVALGLEHGDGEAALGIARGFAMLTYRTPTEFAGRFEGGIDAADPLTCSAPGAYLRARGEAYPNVMSPQRFLSLSASIDRHRVDPEQIPVPTLVIGAETDQLVPPPQIVSLAERLGGPVKLHMLPSLYGHDMFLKDAPRVSELVLPFLRTPA
ncbi:MAG TPA: homoserine O-succinyltransferase [Allosphingosinicella sp.]|nr:homoserine O-succinyltransferase [Allosphingosinicella sp.]